MANEPVRLKSNEFWGKRSGAQSAAKGNFFPGRRGNRTKHDEGQGPRGHKARWNPGRALRRNFGKHGLRTAQKRKG